MCPFFFLDHESNHADGRIQSVDDGAAGICDRYVDPMIDIPKRWRDEYRYSPTFELLGWQRTTPGAETQEFAADGRLIVKKDEAGTPTEFRKIDYEFILDDRHVPALKAVESP